MLTPGYAELLFWLDGPQPDVAIISDHPNLPVVLQQADNRTERRHT